MILEYFNLDITLLFIDDIRVKGLYNNYNNKEVLPRIYQFILEYIQNLDKVLERIERASTYIRKKSQFYINKINIINFIYNIKGSH